MSYILDALKKSDQERQRGKGPSLQTVHRPLIGSRQSPVLFMVVIALFVSLILIVGGLWWYFNSDGFKQSVLKPIPPLTQISSPPPDVAAQKFEETTKANVPKDPVLNLSAVRFNDLDSATRAEIPGLTFSFHVYSDNSARRTIIINGRRVKEGEWVEQGLLLEEITQLGVVFVWRDKSRFTIDVVESW